MDRKRRCWADPGALGVAIRPDRPREGAGALSATRLDHARTGARYPSRNHRSHDQAALGGRDLQRAFRTLRIGSGS